MRTIALAGNPNSGKTTLFNALTGSREKTGNWPGVTVERKESEIEIDGERFRVVDLPGTYSLSSSSPEERVARDALKGEADIVINVVDGTCLPRNLNLTLEILALALPTVIALNFADELVKQNKMPDVNRLSQLLGVPVIPVSGRKKTGFAELARAAKRARPAPPPKGREEILAAADVRGEQSDSVTPAIDRVLLGKYSAYPAFFLIMGLVFFLTFGPIGAALSAPVLRLSDALLSAQRFLPGGVPTEVRDMVFSGIIPGVAGVIAFLPGLLLLFFLLAVLEDTGYMARSAVLFEKPLSRIGLSGRAFIPLMLGFGCTASAILSARATESEREKKMVSLLCPFISCGARLPVYMLMTGVFFPEWSWAVVLFLYGLGVVCLIPAAAILRRLPCFQGKGAGFIMELPPYRLPHMESVLHASLNRARDFFTRAGGVILALSVVIWFLKSYTADFAPAGDVSDSIFASLGRLIAPLFSPMGLADWRQGASLISGIAAKEGIVSSLEILYAPSPVREALAGAFTKASCLAFLAFTALEVPCISALAVLRRETGSGKLLLFSVLLSLSFAYVAGCLTYLIGRWLF